ncbi:MAG: LysM peptidoglycan-binding domain-containing protein [Actinomycetota bacterium]|nr:LysM peptidoglycan-binding domain-containing protein [Actinomycetota bacterium]
MSMYAINDSAPSRTVVEPARSKPAASPPPYLRLVAAPPLQGRTSSAVFWRRRLAVLLVMVALAVAAQAWVGGSRAGPETPRARSTTPAASTGARQEAYVVRKGDTLWAIVRRLRPHGDVRPVVDRLAAQRLRAPLRVGERIVLP